MSWNNNIAGGNAAFEGGVPSQFDQFGGGQAGGFDARGSDNGGFSGNGDAGGVDDRACFNCGKPG